MVEWANWNPNAPKKVEAAPQEDFNVEEIRTKVYRECQYKFPKNPNRKNRCIENGIKKYEHKLFAELSSDVYE